MLHFCTTSDKNFLLKGLVLYNSLTETVKNPITLHWLCLDEETSDIIESLKKSHEKYANIIPYKLSEIEKHDDELMAFKNSGHKSKFGDERTNYIWALTPYFINYILKSGEIPKNEKLIYADSDICFYHDPQIILTAMNGSSIGIHTHRFGGNKKTSESGWYNVGVMVFTNDSVGVKMSDKWKYWCVTPNNKYYETHGTCGDQKYLELFEKYAGILNVSVFDENPAVPLSHRAPWCTHEDGKPVIFYHFSHFTFNIEKGTWADSINGEWKPARHNHIFPYYKNYFEEIKKANTLV